MEKMKTVELKVNKINQLVNKEIFVGQLNILQLKEIIKYTNRISNPNDPFSNPSDPEIEFKYYQRIKNSERSYDIKLFFLRNIWHKYFYDQLRISPLGTFPSSIILALNSFESESHEEFNLFLKTEETPDSAFLSNNTLIIPKTNQGLIVDGQHRIAGLELLLEEASRGYIEIKRANKKDYFTQLKKIPINYIINELISFQFIVSFLIDFDLFEQSEIFATVNFNQQKVNKSFYYDIFGSASSSKSLEKLLHDITSHMNFKSDSPLQNKIKMLGSGAGYFSQAFFVDALIPLFKNGVFQFIYENYQSTSEDYKKITFFLKCYFNAAFKAFSDFLPIENEIKYRDVLLKTTGMGALIKLMPILFNKIKSDRMISNSFKLFDIPKNELENLILSYLNNIKEKGHSYFSGESPFSKGSGKGFQNKLFETMNNDLGFSKKNGILPDMPVI